MANQSNNSKGQVNVEEVVTQSEAFIIKNGKVIIGGVVAVVLAIGGILAYSNLYAAPREETSQAALFKGEEYFRNGNYETALQGDSLGYIGFLQVATQYSGTKTANLAEAYAGLCYKNLKEYEKAVQHLNNFKGNDSMVTPSILGAMGNAYVELNQLDKAVSFLLKAADKAGNTTLSPVFLKQAGLILVKQAKYDDAVRAYTKIKESYFQSYQAMDIDKYIEQARMMKK
jgi:predicted negative regulator of RcsB-dependent stress response